MLGTSNYIANKFNDLCYNYHIIVKYCSKKIINNVKRSIRMENRNELLKTFIPIVIFDFLCLTSVYLTNVTYVN